MSKLGDFMQGQPATTQTATPSKGRNLLSVSPSVETPQVNATPGAIASSIINNSSPETKIDPATLPKSVDEARKMQDENPSMWERISKELMKPIGLVATAAEETGKAIGTQSFDPLLNMPAKMGGILSGTRQRSFSDIWREDAPTVGLNPKVASAIGLYIDIFADPLNALTGGLTKAGTLADKTAKLAKAGEEIKKDSKLAKEISALGLSVDDLILGGTKAEQVQKGQRALLQLSLIGGFEKTLIKGEGIYRGAGAISDTLKATKASEVLTKIFSTKTGNEAFNLAKQHSLDMMEYRKGQAMEEAVNLQKKIIDIGAENQDAIRNVVETGVKTGVAEIDDVALGIKKNLQGMWDKENSLGLIKTKIEDYFPHQKILEDTSVFGKVKNAFGSTKTFDTTMASQKERKITKFVNSLGEEIIGKPKTLGIKPIKISDATQPAIDAGFTHIDSAGNYLREATGAAKATISDINSAFGTEFFDPRLAVVYAKRALSSAKATASAEFYKMLPEFAIKEGQDGVELLPSTISKMEKLGIDMKGKLFSEDIARGIEDYAQSIKPDEINLAFKTFDNVQNWWKAQALVAPSYHIRNMVGNMWNNFLSGMKDPKPYMEAGAIQLGKNVEFIDDAGKQWNTVSIIDAAKKSGVLNQGWYAADIPTAITDEIAGKSWNPLKQNFGLFKANQRIGQTFENNARLAHFIDKIKSGEGIESAAQSVKKYLFDYNDLTQTERIVFKRLAPFYTWTRKNIPLQLEHLFTEPSKTAAVAKTVNAIEGNVETPNEKYLGAYIKDNVGIRVKEDKKGNTMYFLLGNWLPSAQAIDFLSQPWQNFVTSVSPFLKVPAEQWSNQSFFFEDTFGQPSKLERYPEEQGSFLGLTMRKKTINIAKNIRILNELDKLNPGSIFGDSKNPSLLYKTLPKGTGVTLPLGIGHITPTQKTVGKTTPEGTGSERIFQSMFGKTSLYNPAMAKKFYLWDTDTKVRELEKAIKDAQRGGQSEYAKRMIQDLKKVKKERH